jgi:beta-lactamase regulating signal transducer with metallopeptidase domain
MLAWMGYATLAAAALGVTARLVDFAVAGRSGRRRLLWAVVLFASAVGPVVVSVTRGISTAVAAEQSVGAAPAASARAEPIVSDRVLGSAWLAASAVLTLWLVAIQRRLRRRLRGCPSRLVDGERVLVSSDFGPAVVGVVRPQTVLPGWALAMRESDRRIIVAHETEHRRAHDPLLAAAALIAVAALPWNAALWWQLRRLRLAIEIDCDRRVVSRHGHDPHAYGLLLLATRERASRMTRVTPALAMAAMRSALGRRVEALVDGRPRSAVRRLGAVAAAVVLAAGIVSVPAPRLSMARAAVVDAPAAAPPLASAPTPAAPPGPRQPSPPSDASGGRPRQSAAVSPKRRQQRIQRVRPRPALTPARLDASRTRIAGPMTPPAVAPPGDVRSEDGGRRWFGPGSSDSGVARGPGTGSVATHYRLLRSSTAPNRLILRAIRDSLPTPSP